MKKRFSKILAYVLAISITATIGMTQFAFAKMDDIDPGTRTWGNMYLYTDSEYKNCVYKSMVYDKDEPKLEIPRDVTLYYKLECSYAYYCDTVKTNATEYDNKAIKFGDTTEPILCPDVYLYGDVDNSWYVTSYDSLMILKKLAGMEIEPGKYIEKSADINFDNVVDTRDSLLLLKWLTGQTTGSLEDKPQGNITFVEE